MIRKSVKSIQLTLNEMVSILPDHITSVSNAAYTKARQKIRHTAFIELNQKAIADLTYAHEHKRYQGYRLLAVDGSKIMLPDTSANKKTFGTESYKNQYEDSKGEHAWAQASVLYDVLNNIAVDAVLERIDTSEIAMAHHHVTRLRKNDIVILDRGYAAYKIMARIASVEANFIIRCPRAGFTVAKEMFQPDAPDTVTVSLSISQRARNKGDDALPRTLKVRFVRVLLSTGEVEVLATSLTDEKEFPTQQFQELYWYRWGIETFYGTIKTRLTLENFTGISPEAIRQDFFATIFLSGLESILTEDIDENLTQKDTMHKQQVNKAVSFHAIKHRAFDILVGNQDSEQIVQELTALFLTNLTSSQQDKSPPRIHSSSHRILHFWKRKRKFVF